MIRDYLRLVINNMKSRKLRSFLTLVGIVIGVTAIILLYTTGQGLEDVAGSQFDKFGARQILIGPAGITGAAAFRGGPQGARGLTVDDAEIVEKISDVELMTYIFRKSIEVERDKETFITIVGASSLKNIDKSFIDSGLETIEGRLLKEGDRGNIAVIGFSIAKNIFKKDIFVNGKILIDNVPFRVKGILKETGTQADDTSIWIPYDTGKELFSLDDEVTAIAVTIKKGVDLELAAEKIESVLERKRGTDDFTVINPVQLQKQAKEILGVVKLIIVAIGLISLFVGGIGIMNSMYTAVLERTNEIGTMKAIGARNRDILSIFLIESSLMGFIGGVVSVLVSLVFIFLLDKLFAAVAVVPISVTYSIPLFIVAILFSMLTGIAAGMWPAWKASKLQPVEALRYE